MSLRFLALPILLTIFCLDGFANGKEKADFRITINWNHGGITILGEIDKENSITIETTRNLRNGKQISKFKASTQATPLIISKFKKIEEILKQNNKNKNECLNGKIKIEGYMIKETLMACYPEANASLEANLYDLTFISDLQSVSN